MATIVTRSGKGSPLTNTEVDANFTNLNTDKLELSGGTLTGNLSLGDNVKAQFGASNALEIFYDGTQSLISETGTGNLSINGTSINFNNNDLGGRYAEFVSNGAVNLFHAGDKKLATNSSGISVTGSVVADGLTVDNGGSGLNYLQVTNSEGSSRFGTDGGFARILDGSNNLSYASDGVNQYFYTDSNTLRMKLATGGDISFYDGSGNQGLFWDSSTSRLGLGTTNPTYPLDVASSNATSIAYQRTGVSAKKWAFNSDNYNTYWANVTDSIFAMTLSNTGNATFSGSVSTGGNLKVYTAGYPQARLGISDSNYFDFTFDNPTDTLKIGKNGSAKVTVGANGNVNVYNSLMVGATTAPSEKVHISASVTGDYVTSSVSGGPQLLIENTVNDNNSMAGLVFSAKSTTANYARIGGVNFGNGDTKLIFQTSDNQIISEALNLKSSQATFAGNVTSTGLTVDGDVLVNRTSSFTNAAVEVQDDGSGEVLALNNNGTDGQFLRLYNSGTLIGGLGNNTSSVSSLNIYRGSTPAINIASNGDISFYEDTGTTPKLFWDASAESLTVDHRIKVGSTADGISLQIDTGVGSILGVDTGGNGWNDLDIRAGSATQLYLDTSGNVGIGVTNPSTLLTLKAEGSNVPQYSGYTAGGTHIYSMGRDGGNGLGLSAYGTISFRTGATTGFTAGAERFRISADGSCRWTPDGTTHDMTLTADGNLLVGKTALGVGVDGAQFIVGGYSGVSATDNPSFFANRNGGDGSVLEVGKNGVSVGSIGTASGVMYFGSGDVALRTNPIGDAVEPYNTINTNVRDALIDLGSTGARFKDLYLSSGVYLGGTGAQNKLDDYEEGTWNPNTNTNGFTQSISSYSNATYVKIGKMVYVKAKINLSSAGYASSYCRITGLPFSADSFGTGVYTSGGLNTGAKGSLALVLTGTSQLYLHADITTAADQSSWYLSATYEVA